MLWTVPFLLFFLQVIDRNMHHQVSIPTQPCPFGFAIHGNIYSGLYCIYSHNVCRFPLPSYSDSPALTVFPLVHLLHSPAARTVTSVGKLRFSASRNPWRCPPNLMSFHEGSRVSNQSLDPKCPQNIQGCFPFLGYSLGIITVSC